MCCCALFVRNKKEAQRTSSRHVDQTDTSQEIAPLVGAVRSMGKFNPHCPLVAAMKGV